MKEPRDPSKASDIKISPGTNIDYQILGGSEDEPRPVVTICVESPTESPETPDQQRQQQLVSQQSPQRDTVIDIVDPEPIDVNLPRDTSNIFYDYEEPKDIKQTPPEIPPRSHPYSLHDLDKIEYDNQQMSSSTSSASSNKGNCSNSSSSNGDQFPQDEEDLRRAS